LIKLIFLYIVLVMSLEAKHLHKEKYYQDIFCAKMGGVTEYVLEDKSRVDCLTNEYAIEVDFAPKWTESVGQSLYYSLMTGKKAGVYLIIENEKEYRYLKRLKKVAEKYDIKIWNE